MTFFTVWLRGGGGEKSGRAHKFSLLPLQNTISPNWSEKWEKYLDKTAPTSFNVSRSFFFLDKSNAGFLFLVFFSFFLWFCQVVGSSSFPSFFFLNFNFIIFLRKHFWMISYAIFWNVHFHLYTILKKIIVYYFLFYLRGTWWKIYTNLIFNQTKKFFIPPLFHPLNQTQIRKTKNFSILLLFHHLSIFYPLTFPPS